LLLIVKVNFHPTLIIDLTVMSPPNKLESILHTDNPIPHPVGF